MAGDRWFNVWMVYMAVLLVVAWGLVGYESHRWFP